ncbi:DUF4013 domain-containing protein [Methanocaldococcus indicus]|uniref:DUF4013 domain-containing protein n=1 Tax=Methanocaldococcus indicus TaxID=213231 RepID=UPI003C6D8A36
MRSIEDYIKDSYYYITLNFKELLPGAILYFFLGMLSGGSGLFLEKLANNYEFNLSMSIILIITAIVVVAFFIVSFIIQGYLVRVMKTTVEGDGLAPKWNNIFDMFKKGLLYFVGSILLFIVFIFIPAVIFGVGILTFFIAAPIGVIFLILGFVLFFILIVIYGFYKSLADVNYSLNGFFGFFDFKRIFSMMSLKYVVLVILLGIIGVVISSIFSFPRIIVSFLLMKYQLISIVVDSLLYGIQMFVSFYLSVFYIRGIALYYRDRL